MELKGLDALVMRAVKDSDFRQLLETQPDFALAGYNLCAEDKMAIKRVSTTLNAKSAPLARWI